MSPVELFDVITEPGNYTVLYLLDGWTMELQINARSPGNGMCEVQRKLGDICSVTYIERN